MKHLRRMAPALVFLATFAQAEPSHPERRGIGSLPLGKVASAGGASKSARHRDIDVRRSLFVTDLAIVSTFSFADVMDQIARDSPDHLLTKELLFSQWWDTANVAPGLGLGPNCDAETDANGHPSINGFPYLCSRVEGSQATISPFDGPPDARYSAIALSNRYDLASLAKKGTDCGEYRIVFARDSGRANGSERNLIIFEAILPNPAPNGRNLAGCLPVAEFWADLTLDDDPTSRARKLHDFYFLGLPGFGPVIAARNYGNATPTVKGQVRTNQFMSSPSWLLREFSVQLVDGKLMFVPTTLQSNPAPHLFNEGHDDTRGPSFRSAFLKRLKRLKRNDINLFSMPIDDAFKAGDGIVDDAPENSYLRQFESSRRFAARIRARAGSIAPAQLVARAQALSCAGCHQLSNGAELGGGLPRWPKSLQFVHVSERETDVGPDGEPRFVISKALDDVFLPHRKAVLQRALSRR